jgi:hypothetical protein
VQHAALVQLLERNSTITAASKDKNPPILRVMNLEGERMLRSSEGNCAACTRIVSVKKLKVFGKEDKDDVVCFALVFRELAVLHGSVAPLRIALVVHSSSVFQGMF